MSRAVIAIFGLASVAGINAFGPTLAQHIVHAVGFDQSGSAGAAAKVGTQLALATEDARQAAHAGWDSERVARVH